MSNRSTLALVVLLGALSGCGSPSATSDAGAAIDTGSVVDMGSVVDTGSVVDMGLVVDMGSGIDTGIDTGIDASTAIDAATLADAAPTPDAGGTDGVYYVSPTGNDGNAGTIDHPFQTLGRLNAALNARSDHGAGTTSYLRGGTYLSMAGDAASIHFLLEDLHGTAGSPIQIFAYPGEHPIFSCSNVHPTYEYPFAFVLSNSSYVHLRGIAVTFLRQIPSGTGISRGFLAEGIDHCTLDQIEISNIAGGGFAIAQSSSGVPSTHNHILNCDSHHNGDGIGDPANPAYGRWNTGDGFDCTGGDTSTDNVYEGCRSWLNSDDGYDWFDWAGARVTVTNCWSFWNGIRPWGPTVYEPDPSMMTPADPSVFFGNASYVVSFESGEGFKLGGHGAAGPVGMPTVLKKLLDHCVSFENTGTGYAANMDAAYSHQMQIVNSIAYHNGNDGFGFGTGRSVGIAMIFRNDWAFSNNRLQAGGDWTYDGLATNISNNYWATVYGGIDYGDLRGTITLDASDFESVSSAGAAGPRQADGSLPELPFLHLVAGSDLIDRGVDVGLPYLGAHPDIGAYER